MAFNVFARFRPHPPVPQIPKRMVSITLYLVFVKKLVDSDLCLGSEAIRVFAPYASYAIAIGPIALRAFILKQGENA